MYVAALHITGVAKGGLGVSRLPLSNKLQDEGLPMTKYEFVPVAVETAGAMGPQARGFFKELDSVWLRPPQIIIIIQ